MSADAGAGITFTIHVKIRQLRAHAEQMVGGGLDVREVHGFVLRDERVRLHVLEECVRAWVREKQCARQ